MGTLVGFGRCVTRRIAIFCMLMGTFGKRNIAVISMFVSLKINLCVFVLIFIRNIRDLGAFVLFIFFVIGTVEYLCDTAILLGANMGTLVGFGRCVTRRITVFCMLMGTFGKRNIAVLGVFVSLGALICVFFVRRRILFVFRGLFCFIICLIRLEFLF